MSDIHHMPLLGRDLPALPTEDVAEIDLQAWLAQQRKAKVTCRNGWWSWEHNCSWHTGQANGYPYPTLRQAWEAACSHMCRCVASP